MVEHRSPPSGNAHACASVQGQTIDAVVGRGALTAAHLARHLPPRLDRHVLLVTDGHAAYRAFARQHGIAHEAVDLRAAIRVRRGAAGAIHVQNVNAYHSRFRQWLRRFRGVASRYLPNYLGWRWALDGNRIASAEQLLRIAIGLIHSQRRQRLFLSASASTQRNDDTISYGRHHIIDVI
jgi:hypothetical protein